MEGRWHAFGITHPKTPLHSVHDGEHQSFHAKAPMGKLSDVLRKESWKDLPKVLPPGERPGELQKRPCGSVPAHYLRVPV
jgi:beta-fructofuranosidase